MKPDEAEKYIKQSLLTTGLERTFTKTQEATTDDLIKSSARFTNSNKGSGFTNPYGPSTKTPVLIPLPSTKDLSKNKSPEGAKIYGDYLNHYMDLFTQENPKYQGVRQQEKTIIDGLKKISPQLAAIAQGRVKDISRFQQALAGPFDNSIQTNPLSGTLNAIWQFGTGGVGYQVKDDLIEAGVAPEKAAEYLQQAQGLLKEYEKLNLGPMYDMYADFNKWENNMDNRAAEVSRLTLPVTVKQEDFNNFTGLMEKQHNFADFNIISTDNPDVNPAELQGKNLKYEFVSPTETSIPGYGVVLELRIPNPNKKEGEESYTVVYATTKKDAKNKEKLVTELSDIYQRDLGTIDYVGKLPISPGQRLSDVPELGGLRGTGAENIQLLGTGGNYQFGVNGQSLTLKSFLDNFVPPANQYGAILEYAVNTGYVSNDLWQNAAKGDATAKQQLDSIVSQLSQQSSFTDYQNVLSLIFNKNYLQ
jgi:hypothetical protein